MLGLGVFLLVVLAGIAYLFIRARAGGVRGNGAARRPRSPSRRGSGTAKSSAAATPAERLAELRYDGSYWGVMVQTPPGQGCAAARELREKKFSLERAPPLPLAACDESHCRCNYLGLKERRRRDVLPTESEDRRTSSQVKWDNHHQT